MNKIIYFSIIILVIVGMLFVLNRKNPEEQKIPTSADNAPTGSLHNLPVPTPVALAKKAGAEVLGIPEGEAIVMSAFEKEWPDSCLGLPDTEEMCLQVITKGYEVTVQGNGKEVVYRTNMDGSSIRQEK